MFVLAHKQASWSICTLCDVLYACLLIRKMSQVASELTASWAVGFDI